MSTTARDLITAAYAHRTANDPDKLAKTAELIRVLERKLLAVYAHVHEINPWFFSKSAAVVGVSSTWARPTDASRVLWIHSGADPVAGRVNIVPFRNVEADLAPRLYQLGRTFYPTGHASDPTGTASLTFVYAFQHPALDSTLAWDHATNTLDDSWPEHYNDLLVLPIAKYLAQKDGRSPTEIGLLEEERKELLALLEREVKQHLSAAERWSVSG